MPRLAYLFTPGCIIIIEQVAGVTLQQAAFPIGEISHFISGQYIYRKRKIS